MDPTYPSIGHRYMNPQDCLDRGLQVNATMCPMDVSCFTSTFSDESEIPVITCVYRYVASSLTISVFPSSLSTSQCVNNSMILNTAHGGGGYILSIGLLRLYPFQRALEQVDKQGGCSGGDCLLTRVFWFTGQAFTDPGPGIVSKARDAILFDNRQIGGLVENFDELVLSNACDHFCW